MATAAEIRDIEHLAIDQIQAMGPTQILAALDLCIVATCELGAEAISAENALAAIEIAWCRQDGTYTSKSEYDAARRRARRDCNVTKIRNATIKRIQSAIQSKARHVAI
jgi:hypothetical protein